MRIGHSTTPTLRKETLDYLRNYARTYRHNHPETELNAASEALANEAPASNIRLYYLTDCLDKGEC